jgi:N-methylhydantoinase A
MRLGVDVGGTFTDLVGWDPHTDRVVLGKALNDVSGTTDGIRDAIRQVGMDSEDITELIHGTTMITNLLIERNAGRVGLICSQGFRDLLEIQLSWRARTFDLGYLKSPPLIPRHLRLEVPGRMRSNGAEEIPLDKKAVAEAARSLVDAGVESVVVALYNSYANPAHERVAGEIVRSIVRGVPVTLATDVDARMGEYQRVSTAVLNATAVPRMRSYSSALGAILQTPTFYMHSAGGMMPAKEATERPIQLAFSGPAAGVLAGRSVASSLGFENAITMDMGGTSCDVCLIWNGELQYRDQIDVDWGIPARIRSLAVHTVGAGGGSVAWKDPGGALQVGPLSAGARPGPVCYGRGGTEPTVTDANLVLGIISSEAGLIGGQLELLDEEAGKALDALGQQFDVKAAEIALAIHRIVNANMAQAIREITVRQGIDPRDCVLVAFGGAGGQHAAGVAHELGIATVVFPTNGSLLSAAGLLLADLQVSAQETILAQLHDLDQESTREAFSRLIVEARARLELDESSDLVVERFASMRYVAQSHEIVVPLDEHFAGAAATFEAEHERLFGTRLGDPIEVVDLHVTASVKDRPNPDPSVLASPASPYASADSRRFVHLQGSEVSVLARDQVVDGTKGPCLLEEANSVVYVPAFGIIRIAHPHLVVELSHG